MATGSILVYAYILIYCFKELGFENEGFEVESFFRRGLHPSEITLRYLTGQADFQTKVNKKIGHRERGGRREKFSHELTRIGTNFLNAD